PPTQAVLWSCAASKANPFLFVNKHSCPIVDFRHFRQNMAATGLRNCKIKAVYHYENPRTQGSLDKSTKNVGTGLVGAPACGDVMKRQIQVDESGKIVDAKFKKFGCGSAIASSSLATEWVKGKSIDEALKNKNTIKDNKHINAIKTALSDCRLN
uniref:Iron-sulfur cluster assembly enzyme a n=1 Tax=Cynoglossus semilaevis TaxID=244447 RepID=A0A3P8VZ91_CYNSE